MGFVINDFFEINLGFRSLLNDFYYVGKDKIHKYKIEARFLVPIHMLADLDSDAYFQSRAPSRWLFNCREKPGDLRGTGAARYIRWGAEQETTLRKQTGQSVKWPDAPALAKQKQWYSVSWPIQRTQIALRKGIGVRYAPFLFAEPALVDQRLYGLQPKDGIDVTAAQAFIASSLFPLALETNADLGPGAGVLTLSTEMLRELPSIDLAALSRSKLLPSVRAAANRLFATAPTDADHLPDIAALRELDAQLLRAIGLRPERAEELEREVVRLSKVRIAKSKLRRVIRAAAANADVDAVASAIAKDLSMWLAARRFPEDAGPFERELAVDLPDGPFVVSVEQLVNLADVTVIDSRGSIRLKQRLGVHAAELLVRCLQFGRRKFSLPLETSDVTRSLDACARLVKELDSEFGRLLNETGIGPRHHNTVFKAVQDKVSVQLEDLFLPYMPERPFAIAG